MKLFRSRIAISLAALAATTMVASPALAHGDWGRHRHHRDGIDGGAVIAGILAIGGIAALVSAANSDKKAREEQRQLDPDYYQQPQVEQQGYAADGYDGNGVGGNGYASGPRPAYPGGPIPGEPGYAAPQDSDAAPYGNARDHAEGDYAAGSFDAAVDRCSDEIERGDRRISDVESVRRMGERIAVEGRLADGRGFACSVDAEGRIRSVSVDGHAMI